jgi:hypothetical protein
MFLLLLGTAQKRLSRLHWLGIICANPLDSPVLDFSRVETFNREIALNVFPSHGSKEQRLLAFNSFFYGSYQAVALETQTVQGL